MIVDLILIAIILLFSFVGAKNGFTSSVLAFVNKIIALIISLFFAKPFALILEKTPLGTLAEKIIHPLYDIELLNSLDSTIILQIKWYVLIIFAFVILYIASFFALKLLKALADIITDLPVLKQIDSLLGFLLGCASSLVVIFILLAILSVFKDVSMFDGIFSQIEQSYLTAFLYDNNIILNILFNGNFIADKIIPKL